MKKLLKSICVLLSILLVLSINFSAVAASPLDLNNSVYKVLPGSSEWESYDTLQKKINVCQIPENTLSSVSTENLLELILRYPLIINIFAFDSIQEGLKSVSSYFNGIQELYTRTDKDTVLLSYFQNMDTITSISNSNDFSKIMDLTIIEALISSDEVYESLSYNQKIHFSNLVQEKYNSKILNKSLYSLCISPYYEKLAYQQNKVVSRNLTTTVKTPGGTSVTVIIVTNDMDQSAKNYINNLYDSTYPSATRLGSATLKYNCHSYAWYQQSTSNPYWMEDPSDYWSDGSYSRVLNPQAGDKVYYPSNNVFDGDTGSHSAIVYSNTSTLWLQSKWGQAGLYRHTIDDCPYTAYTIYYYR